MIDVHHGRGATYLVQDKYKRRIVIRHYYRGGFIGRILEDKFLKFFKSSRRSFNEFELLITMKKWDYLYQNLLWREWKKIFSL